MREAIYEMGTTAKELAKQVGVSAGRISDYMNDKSEPSLSTTRRIVSILKLSPEQVACYLRYNYSKTGWTLM